MASAIGLDRSIMRRGWRAAIMLATAAFAAIPARADIIKKEDLLRGITMLRPQCDAMKQAVWVTVYGRDFCVRFYLSTAGGEGTRPVVFLNGDANGPVDTTVDRDNNIVRFAWNDPSRAQDENTDAFVEIADDFSKMAKTTAIYIGRIGDGGTSGNHLNRKTVLELGLMNAALDALRQRYRFDGFHLAGESGGGRLVFALAAARHDIGCVISGSGQLVVTEAGKSKLHDPGQTYFDTMAGLPSMAQNRAERVMMITDPVDQQVPPATEQTPVLTRLRQLGGRVPQFLVQSTDPRHHSVLEYVELVTAGCVLGKRDEDITRAVGTIIRRDTDLNQLQRDKAAAKAAATR